MIDMDQVLAALEQNSNPEDAFAQSLQEFETETEKVAEVAYPVEQVMETPETPAEDDREKVAEADAQGRIMAHGFWNELQKIAVAPVAEYPADPGMIPMNPAVEVGRGEGAQPYPEKQMKVNQIINSLSAANKVGAGEIATPAGPMPVAKDHPQAGNQPLVYDQQVAAERAATGGAVEKKAEANGAAAIINSLYETYFGEEA